MAGWSPQPRVAAPNERIAPSGVDSHIFIKKGSVTVADRTWFFSWIQDDCGAVGLLRPTWQRLKTSH